MERRLCQLCAFFEPIPGEGKGECHFNPPVPDKGFAQTSPASWCSRFRFEFSVPEISGKRKGDSG